MILTFVCRERKEKDRERESTKAEKVVNQQPIDLTGTRGPRFWQKITINYVSIHVDRSVDSIHKNVVFIQFSNQNVTSLKNLILSIYLLHVYPWPVLWNKNDKTVNFISAVKYQVLFTKLNWYLHRLIFTMWKYLKCYFHSLKQIVI